MGVGNRQAALSLAFGELDAVLGIGANSSKHEHTSRGNYVLGERLPSRPGFSLTTSHPSTQRIATPIHCTAPNAGERILYPAKKRNLFWSARSCSRSNRCHGAAYVPECLKRHAQLRRVSELLQRAKPISNRPSELERFARSRFIRPDASCFPRSWSWSGIAPIARSCYRHFTFASELVFTS